MIPIWDQALARRLIRTFAVDVLIPVEASPKAEAFVRAFPHLHGPYWAGQVFSDTDCAFVDVRHAAAMMNRRPKPVPREPSPARPKWNNDDPLGAAFGLLFGSFPAVEEVRIDYAGGLSRALHMTDFSIGPQDDLSPLISRTTPLDIASFGLKGHGYTHWRHPGIVHGNAANFDDLLMLWNLRAAGADVRFYDPTFANRLQNYIDAFLGFWRQHADNEGTRVNLWSRSAELPTDLDLTGLQVCQCRGGDGIWNGLNIKPFSPKFSSWHQDVVPSYLETEGGSSASFALPDLPFDTEIRGVRSQHFVVTVDAKQYQLSDDLTYRTPFLPVLNEFYGRNFYCEFDHARSESGSFGHGAVGIITDVGAQRLEVWAVRVFNLLQNLFNSFGFEIHRSEPGILCTRLIRQLGGLLGCRVLKIRGADLFP